MPLKNSLKTAIAIPIIAAGTGLASLLAGCEGSDSEPAEEMIDVHITQSTTNKNQNGAVWVYPACIDTNIPLSEYESNPSAYLLSASNCVYFSKNHEPFRKSKQAPGGHGGDL